MADLSALSDEELFQAAGLSGGGGGTDNSKISDEDLFRMANLEEPETILGTMKKGALNLPSDLWNTAKSVGSFASHPLQSIEDAGIVDTAKVTGRLAAGGAGATAGGATGAAVGAFGGPLAPVTVPLGALVGAGVGGAAGLLGFNKLAEAGESRDLSKLEPTRQDLLDFTYNATQGSLVGAAGKAAQLGARGTQGAIRGTANLAEQGAKNFAQDALAVKPGVLEQSAKRGVQFVDDAGNTVPIEDASGLMSRVGQRVEDVRGSELFSKLSNDPTKAAIQVTQEIDNLNTAKNALVTEVDSGIQAFNAEHGINVKLKPDWTLAEQYIEKGQGTAGLKPRLARELGKIQNDWNRKGGTFADLINFKSELNPGGKFFAGVSDSASIKLREAIAIGVKRAAEKTADAVFTRTKPELVGQFEKLNGSIADLIPIKDFLITKGARSGGALARAGDAFKSLKNLGVGAAATLAGKPELGAAYLGMEALGEAFPATASRGLSRVASGIEKGAKGASIFTSPLEAAGGVFSSPAAIGALEGATPDLSEISPSPGIEGETAPTSLLRSSPDSTAAPVGPQSANPLDMLSQAIAQVESGGKVNARSDKGAVGTHQVTPIAMREVMRSQGQDDKRFSDAELRSLALEPGVSKQFGDAYTQFLMEKYDDPRLVLAAYNAGPTAVSKLLKSTGGNSFEDIAAKLPKETREYVPKVEQVFLKLLERDQGVAA